MDFRSWPLICWYISRTGPSASEGGNRADERHAVLLLLRPRGELQQLADGGRGLESRAGQHQHRALLPADRAARHEAAEAGRGGSGGGLDVQTLPRELA